MMPRDVQHRRISRRQCLASAAASAATVFAGLPAFCQDLPSRTFRLWVTSDPHVGTDLWAMEKGRRVARKGARESLAEAIRQSESAAGFDWDIALCLGDFSGNQGIPDDEEGRQIVDQFAALRKHRREAFYCLGGNHDASPANAWFRRWLDPLGESPRHSGVEAQRMPYRATGTWERYAFRVGNLLMLMMSDRNEFAPPVGRIRDGKGYGGRPPGAVTKETFQWWQQTVEDQRDAIIVSAHHHMLRETTLASGPWEGTGKPDSSGRRPRGYHGYFEEDGPHNAGASYLYWLVDEGRQPLEATPDAQAFENYLAAHPGAIDLWLGGHTHARPDTVVAGRSHLERRWNVGFLNAAALTRFHATSHSVPMSRLLTFTEQSEQVRVQCYLHTSQYAPQGWYAKAERSLRLSKPFRWK